MEFGFTKWFVRDWSEEQKIEFQNKAFELGYGWGTKGENQKIMHLLYQVYFLNVEGSLTASVPLSVREFDKDFRLEKTWEDMFPTPKLNLVEEIVAMVFPEEEEGIEEEEDEDEDEGGFEGLSYVQPKFIEQYYVLPLSLVSEEQLSFLEDNLPFHPKGGRKDYHSNEGLANLSGKDGWFFFNGTMDVSDVRITFNELFPYKEEE